MNRTFVRGILLLDEAAISSLLPASLRRATPNHRMQRTVQQRRFAPPLSGR
jgi:hypothetical protein